MLVSLVLGGRNGLLLLWILALVFWATSLYSAFVEEHWVLVSAAKLFSDRFAFWSGLTFPLAAATALYLRGWRAGPVGVRAVLVCAAWLVLITNSAYLSHFAPDVGGPPRDLPLNKWMMGIILPFFPVFVCGWVILNLRVRTSQQRAR